MALIGPAGSGKTYTALNIAQHLGGPIAVLDTEHGSASKYADRFEFDTMEPSNFNPQVYIDAIHEAERAGYKLMIIDSLPGWDAVAHWNSLTRLPSVQSPVIRSQPGAK